MVRLVAAAVGGIFAGAAAVWLFAPQAAPPGVETVVRDIVAVPSMSGADAETHRASGYTKLSTIEGIQALPTAFARAEALFALAGRSGPAELQALIFDANRIADDNVRRESLSTLFFRLAEADPESALALARTEFFRNERNLESIVWQAWARKDLDGAIFAAKTQTSAVNQNAAAQGLFAAHGDLGNDTTDRIEAELGIGPDRETRGRYLYRLADRSPQEAIAYVNAMPDGYVKSEHVSWLAHYLARRDPASAAGYAELLTDERYRDMYKGSVMTRAALENPSAEIDRILASGNLRENMGPLHSAMRVLVAQDFEAAMAYFDAMTSGEQRQMIGAVIATEFAQKDPIAALAWARENNLDRHRHIEMDVLSTLAQTDPQRALAEALQNKNSGMRHQHVTMVINSIGHRDPAEAIALLESIDDPQLLDNVRQSFGAQWLQQDPDAAIDWILSQDERTTARILQNASWSLVQTNLDAALKLLPKVNEGSRAQWRRMIATTMATERSVSDAMQFVRQFENEPDYPELQGLIIQSVAQTDIAQARLLADQLNDTAARDQAYYSITIQRAQTHPYEAVQLVNAIADEPLRQSAMAQAISHWYQSDPAATTRWLTNLPAGPGRDQAIQHLARQWHTVTREQDTLINSISDRDMRTAAKIQRAFAVAQFDRARAQSLLDDPDISDQQRQQALQQFDHIGIRY